MFGYLLLSILPLATSSVAIAYRRSRSLAPVIAVATLAVVFLAAGRTFPQWQVSEILLSFDPWSRMAYTSFLMLAALGIVYGWLAGENQRLFATGLAVTGFLGLTFSLSRDLLSAGVAFELAALAAVFGFGLGTGDNSIGRKSMRYVSYLVVAGACLLGALSLAARFEITRDPAIERIAFALLAVFLLIVLGVFPFNMWFPRNLDRGELMMVALLASALSIGGAWLFVQSYANFPWLLAEKSPISVLMAVATFGTVASSLVAATRRRLDHLISFSMASNTGTVVVGLATGSYLGVVGGMFALLNSLFAILLLIMCVDIGRTGGENGEPGAGMRRTTTTILGLCLGGLALSGAPLTAGYVGRWMIYEAVSDQSGYLPFLLVISSALVFLGFARYLREVWALTAPGETPEEEPAVLATIVTLLAMLILVVGVFPTPIIQTMSEAIAGMPFL